MRTFHFGKVIRDKILVAMQEEGCEVEYRELHGPERQKKLVEKLIEEAAEVADAQSQDGFIEELVDVQLVIDALTEGLDEEARNQLDVLHRSKLDKKGGFSKSIWINSVSVPDNSKWIKYFEDYPEKYPEIKA